MLESEIVKRVKKFAEKLGWMVRKLMYQGRHGCPDNWFFRAPGQLVIIEFKQRGKKPTEIQAAEIQRLRDCGFEVHVIDNVEDGCELFRRKERGHNGGPSLRSSAWDLV